MKCYNQMIISIFFFVTFQAINNSQLESSSSALNFMDLFNFILTPTQITPPKSNYSNKLSKSKSSNKELTKLIKKKKFKKKKDQIKIKKRKADPNTIYKFGWLKISSKVFTNLRRYPKIIIPGKKIHNIIVDTNYFRLNDEYSRYSKSIPHHRDFWFRLSGRLLYYSNRKEDINVLDSIYIKNIKSVLSISNYSKNTNCFKINDIRQQTFKICAHTIEEKVEWICKIKEILRKPKEVACGGTYVKKPTQKPIEENNEIATLEKTYVTQKVNQPLIIIPQASRKCNEKWDYSNKGNDWECKCSEGKEQSPIDLPSTNQAVSSPVKPYFNYIEFTPFLDSSTYNGKQIGGKRMRIRYVDNALRIFHNNMGKVTTLDGGIYIAEEIVFHSPSEHTINGEQYDMEMQVIHTGKSKGSIGKQVVLSILFKNKPGVHNKFIDKLDFFNLPNKIDKYREIKQNLFIPHVFLESDTEDSFTINSFSFFTYQGSISSPPCSERTIVYVATSPAPIGFTALAMFQEAIKNRDFNPDGDIEVSSLGGASNNRETQVLNGRAIFYYDHLKYSGPTDLIAKAKRKINKKKGKRSKISGHYEKHILSSEHYFYVDSESPSGLPGAYVVSENEAKGLGNPF